jgi:hypothetical protein
VKTLSHLTLKDDTEAVFLKVPLYVVAATLGKRLSGLPIIST